MMAASSVSALRKYVRPRDTGEKCDTCGASIPVEHVHLFDPKTRRIRCACRKCAIISGTLYQEIPRRVRALPNFSLSDAQWEELLIPISLAFFSYSTTVGKVIALYPGPAGAAESLLRLDAWQEIIDNNPELKQMQPDVEALLVNRVGATREYFVVPIDACYQLVGTIRLHWRGLSGGSIVWGEISRFFDELRRKGGACPS